MHPPRLEYAKDFSACALWAYLGWLSWVWSLILPFFSALWQTHTLEHPPSSATCPRKTHFFVWLPLPYFPPSSDCGKLFRKWSLFSCIFRSKYPFISPQMIEMLNCLYISLLRGLYIGSSNRFLKAFSFSSFFPPGRHPPIQKVH